MESILLTSTDEQATFYIQVPGFQKSSEEQSSDEQEQDYAFDQLEETEDDADEPNITKKDLDESTECTTKKSRKTIVPRNYHFCNHEGCNKKYANVNHLKVHMRSHTGDRPFKCDFDGCNKSFTTSYSQKSHIRTHTNERPYICSMDTCRKGFKTSGDLQKHCRTHTGFRPFSCTVDGCNKAFTTSNILKTHLRVHTGERPYECPHPNCGKSFSSSTNYRNHVRIHSGEKPFECKFKNCGKRFTEYSSLYKHKSVHTITKSFSCSICLKTFRQESSLTLHRRNVHGLEFPDKVNVLDVRIDGNEQLNASKIISISTGEDNLLLDKNYQPISITLDSQQIILLSNAVE